jgi:hypothetical protein
VDEIIAVLPQDRRQLGIRLLSLITIDPVTGCWLMRPNPKAGGYALVKVNGRTRRAHRVTYELWIGPIGAGLVLDHRCRVRNCVRPAHLEPVTVAENNRRSDLVLSTINAAKVICNAGHELSGKNLRVDPDGRRRCRACHLDRARESAALHPRPRRTRAVR